MNELRFWRDPLVLAHAAVITGLTVLLVVLIFAADGAAAEECIGAGAASLARAVLGLPWSLAALAAETLEAGVVVLVAAALVNLAIHIILRPGRRLRRQL
jgi:hypothetical protein